MNKSEKVTAYMANLDHPFKPLWEEIRETILGTDIKMTEEIKWGAPTFIYKGNLATFNPRAKKIVNLTFHTGATIEDPEGVLEGDANEAHVFRVENAEDLKRKKSGLKSVVQAWIAMQDG